jgi:hypothetical protein
MFVNLKEFKQLYLLTLTDIIKWTHVLAIFSFLLFIFYNFLNHE